MKFHAIALLILSLSSICYSKNATLVLVKDAVTKVRANVTVPRPSPSIYAATLHTPGSSVLGRLGSRLLHSSR